MSQTEQEPKRKLTSTELEDIKVFNESLLTSELITPDKLYVDLSLIKDYYIGAMLSFYHDMKLDRDDAGRKALYQSLLDGIKDYTKRTFNDIASYFPKFGLTTQQIIARIEDPNYARYLLHNAPMTPFTNTLKAQIAVNVNHSAVVQKRSPILIRINTYPLNLSEQDRHIIGIHFSGLLKVNIEVVYQDPKTITLEDMLSFDEVYTAHVSALLNNSQIRQAYTDLKFMTKRLFIVKTFGPSVNPLIDIQKEELAIRASFEFLTHFQFIPVASCSVIPLS